MVREKSTDSGDNQAWIWIPPNPNTLHLPVIPCVPIMLYLYVTYTVLTPCLTCKIFRKETVKPGLRG